MKVWFRVYLGLSLFTKYLAIANSSLPAVQQALRNQRVGADSRADRMNIWLQNVESMCAQTATLGTLFMPSIFQRSSLMHGKTLLRMLACFPHFPSLLDPRLAGHLVIVLVIVRVGLPALRVGLSLPIKSSRSRKIRTQTKASSLR